jgi:ubiquitin C-terminal hydrolase
MNNNMNPRTMNNGGGMIMKKYQNKYNMNQSQNNFMNYNNNYMNNKMNNNPNSIYNNNNFNNMNMMNNNNINMLNYNKNMGMNNMSNSMNIGINNMNNAALITNFQNMMAAQTKNFNYNQMNNNIVKKPLHKTGLQNLGQTCYMNSSLQCLANIDIFSDLLLKNISNLIQFKEKYPFTYAYVNLLYQLKNSTEKYLNPSDFKSVLDKFNPLFEGNKASDAKDLILFILQRLHLELKPPKQNLNAKMDFYQQEQISLNDENARNQFLNDFNSSKSFVSLTFHGIIKIQLACDNCHKIKYSYQTFNLLTFILKNIKEYKMKEIGDYYTEINIFDAFEKDRKEEILTGQNMIFCNSCQTTCSGTTKQEIYSLPPVLIIVLNRGKDNQDFNENFNFPEVLDFTENTFVISNNNFKRFFLCGIITHLGESSSSGHFICYCRKDLNDPFLCYNDTQTADGIEIDEGMKCNISNNSYEKRTPYILFYHYF